MARKLQLIGSGSFSEFVKTSVQNLTEEQQEQARINIGFTEENALALVVEMALVNPITNENGAVFTDENGIIYVL